MKQNAFTETHISKNGFGIYVQLLPVFRQPPFEYGSPKDRLFNFEYPEEYKPSWIKPYHVNNKLVCDDSRISMDCEVHRTAFKKALAYAKTLNLPIKAWDAEQLVWFEVK